MNGALSPEYRRAFVDRMVREALAELKAQLRYINLDGAFDWRMSDE